MYLMAIQAGAALIGGAMGKSAADKAAENMQELLDDQLQLKEAEFQENKKRAQKTARMELGAAKAASFASGIQNTGTTKHFQQEMKSQWDADMAWAEQKNRLEQSIMTQQAKLGMDSAEMAGKNAILKGIGGAAQAGISGGLMDKLKSDAPASAISMTGDTKFRSP